MLKVETPESYTAERLHALNVGLDDWLGIDWGLEQADCRDVRLTHSGLPGEVRLPDILFQAPFDTSHRICSL